MRIVEFGQKGAPVAVLLHGGGLSWWNYREAARLLQDKVRVVLPVLDGHAGSERHFTSIEDNAREVIGWIDAEAGGCAAVLGGLSLGAQVAVEMLWQRPDICRGALIESASVLPMRLTGAMLGPSVRMSYPLVSKEWFTRLQFGALHMPEAYYEDYRRDSREIALEDMLAFLKANAAYALKDGLGKTRAKIEICVGGREPGGMRRSAQKLHEAMPGSALRVLPGLRHGELSLGQPEEYARRVLGLL